MARRGSRGSGAGSASPTTSSAAPASKGVWKMLAGGLLVLVLLSWFLPSGSISSLLWGFLIALILGTILIFGFIYTVGGKKLPSTPDGFWAALKNYKTPILWVAAIIWLFGINGFWQLIWSPGGFVADRAATVGEVWEGNPSQPDYMKPNGRENSFNDHDVPNYWINYAKPKGEELAYRGDGAEGIRSCETNLTAVWGDENGQGGANSSGPVYRHNGGTMTTIDGTPVAIPANAIVCTAGPRGSALVLATGPAYHAYEQLWQQKQASGTACDTTRYQPSMGWQCQVLASGESYTVPTRDASKCYKDDFRAGISIKGLLTADDGTKLWVWRENGVDYEARLAENYSAVERVFYYRIFDKPTGGCPA